jgi:hypothetical protein
MGSYATEGCKIFVSVLVRHPAAYPHIAQVLAVLILTQPPFLCLCIISILCDATPVYTVW